MVRALAGGRHCGGLGGRLPYVLGRQGVVARPGGGRPHRAGVLGLVRPGVEVDGGRDRRLAGLQGGRAGVDAEGWGLEGMEGEGSTPGVREGQGGQVVGGQGGEGQGGELGGGQPHRVVEVGVDV